MFLRHKCDDLNAKHIWFLNGKSVLDCQVVWIRDSKNLKTFKKTKLLIEFQMNFDFGHSAFIFQMLFLDMSTQFAYRQLWFCLLSIEEL